MRAAARRCYPIALGVAAHVRPRARGFEEQGPWRIRLRGLLTPHIGGESAVSAGREVAVMQAWQGFLRAIGDHLKAHGFAWGRPARRFLRVYFDACGMARGVHGPGALIGRSPTFVAQSLRA